MKRITLLLSLLITSIGFSQEILQDFETAGLGDAFGGSSAELVADPQSGGTRGQVAKLTSSTSAGAQIWQGINISLEKNVQLTTDKTMKIDVYSTSAISIAPKVIGGLDGAPDSTAAVSHMGTGWETLTITFNQGLDGTTTANGVYGAFVVYYLWDTTANGFINPVIDRTFYVDNIEGIGVAPVVVTGPTTDAPTPTQNAADVISLFSDTYTDITSNRNPGWSEVVTAETHASNEVLKTTNFVPFAIATPIDITDHTLHVDVWLPQLPSAGAGLLIKILDQANGPHEGNYTYPIANITAGEWNSIDININDFNQTQGTWDATAQGRVDQVLVDIVDDTTMYVDNIYFWKAPTAGLDDPSLSAVEMYPNPAIGVVKFSTVSKEALEVAVYDLLGKQVMPFQTIQTELNISSLTTGLYFVKMKQGSSATTKKLLVN